MCGVLFLHGPAAGERVAEAILKLRHRGPDDTVVWTEGRSALGFTRLAITDTSKAGLQPFVHGSRVGAFNGEVFNHAELIERHGLEVGGTCDVRVILPLYERMGANIIDELDGFYSGVILGDDQASVTCLRDQMGKKPLIVGRTGTEVFITSELKAVDPVEWFATVPMGVSRVDLRSGEVSMVRPHVPQPVESDLVQLLGNAVAKRIPPEGQPVGLFLSGGLDSSIVAAIASRFRDNIRYYCLARRDAPDLEYTRLLCDSLGLRDVRVVELPSAEELPRLLDQVVYATESYNPSIVSNGLGTYLLSSAVQADGVRIVLTGEGADELFGGYHRFAAGDPWRETRDRLLGDMHFTELRRLDAGSMACGVEARCPFLDRQMVSYAMSLGHSDLYAETTAGRINKVALRRAFADALPDAVIGRQKTSFDVGSGLRREVVEYLRRRGRTEREELRDLWTRLFCSDHAHPYFHEYPMFDHAIDVRGAAHR